MDGNGREYTRRAFLKGAAGASAAALVPGAPGGIARAAEAAKEGEKGGGRPRIGCLSWCFHSFEGGSNPEEAIDIIGEIGFEGIELILLSRRDIEGFWTDATIDRLKGKLERNKLQLSQFVIFQPVVEGLTSVDPEERKRNLDFFEAGCRIGKKLGAPMIDIVAPWARELKGHDYLPRYYEISSPKPGEKFRIDIDPSFDWDRVWQGYIEATRECLARVKAHGMKLSIEHHTHCMVPDASSFLRLWDAVRDPALGYNLDAGWTQLQREYPPVAIHKVKDHLMNLHMRDIDGLMRNFVHVGEGVMDFEGIARALKAVGFRGFLSIEQDKHPGDMSATCRRYLEMMRQYLG